MRNIDPYLAPAQYVQIGSLRDQEFVEILSTIRSVTGQDDVALAFWCGTGGVESIVGSSAAVTRIAGNDYWVADAHVSSVPEDLRSIGHHRPTMVLAFDEAWMIHTDLDQPSTFLAGQADVVSAVRSLENLETVSVESGTSIAY